jgi:hypothetical protein
MSSDARTGRGSRVTLPSAWITLQLVLLADAVEGGSGMHDGLFPMVHWGERARGVLICGSGGVRERGSVGDQWRWCGYMGMQVEEELVNGW